MAIQFDESTDYYAIADSADLTLPNGDWCIGFWTKLDNNTGSLFQYLISNNSFSANNSINIYICEASDATSPNQWRITAEDGSANNLGNVSATAIDIDNQYGADGVMRLFVIQRNKTLERIEWYSCPAGGTVVNEFTTNGYPDTTGFGSINGGVWNIGRRTDGNADRYWGGITAEFFKGDFILTSDEVAALGRGYTPMRLGHIPDIYLPMRTTGNQVDIIGANNATENGTPAIAEHFLMQPFGVMPVFVLAADASGATVNLNTLTLASSAVSLSVTPGAISTALNTITLASSAVALSVAPGAISTALNTITLASSAVSLSVLSGGSQVSLSTVTLASSTPALSVTVGAVSVSLSSITLASSAVNLTALSAGTIPLNTLTFASSTPALTVTPGAISVTTNTLTLASSAVSLTVTIGTSVSLNTLSLASSAVALSVTPGAASVSLSALILALSTVTITPDNGRGVFNRDNAAFIKFRDKRISIVFRDKRSVI